MSSQKAEKVTRQHRWYPTPSKPTVQSWCWSVAVLVAFIAQAIMNVLAGEQFGSFGGGSNQQVSKENPTFLTPDGMTFSVWGFIYLFQALFCIYQVIPCFQNSHMGVSKARFWVVILFLTNCLWLPVFSNYRFFLALLLMLLMDVSLIMIYRIMSINYGAIDQTQGADQFLPSLVLEDAASTQERVNGDLPRARAHNWMVKTLCFVGFSTNISWLAVASMVNVLVAAGNAGWQKAFEVVSVATNSSTTTTAIKIVYICGNQDFAVMGTGLVALLACVLVIRNGDVPYAAVAMWALGGVYRAQAVKASTGYPEKAMSPMIANWALAMIIVIGIATLIGLIKAVVETVCANRMAVADAPRHAEDKHIFTDASKKQLYTDEGENLGENP